MKPEEDIVKRVLRIAAMAGRPFGDTADSLNAKTKTKVLSSPSVVAVWAVLANVCHTMESLTKTTDGRGREKCVRRVEKRWDDMEMCASWGVHREHTTTKGDCQWKDTRRRWWSLVMAVIATRQPHTEKDWDCNWQTLTPLETGTKAH